MELTEALRRYVRETFGLKSDCTDDQIRDAVMTNLKSGTLSMDKLADLSKKQADGLAQLDTRIAGVVDAKLKPVNDTLAVMAESLKTLVGVKTDDAAKVAEKAAADKLAEDAKAAASSQAKSANDPYAILIEGHKASRSDTVRVKPVKEMYNTSKKDACFPEYTKNGLKHGYAGQQAVLAGRPMQHASEFEKAQLGSWLKWQLGRGQSAPAWTKMTDHDKDLFKWLVNEEEFYAIDSDDSVKRVKLSDRKDLLDDATSGALEIAPIVFDDMIMLTPVLNGELFPKVKVVNLARGRRVEGASMSNPTFTSGTAEGSAITPFDTTAYVAAIDTTIYPVVSAVKVGMDLEDDSPIGISDTLVMQFSEKMMEWLDNQIANGDGTTEMEGVFVASGTVAVAPALLNGPQTVGDYENLYFGITKPFRTRGQYGNAVSFLANDVSYKRSRQVPVGSDDARRVFGMDHASYRLLDTPYLVQNDIANTKIACVNLAGYRCYKRLGMTVRLEQAGATLALANERLIVVRGRFGGRLMLGGYAAVCTAAQP